MPRCTIAIRCSALIRRACAWPTIPEMIATMATKKAPSGTIIDSSDIAENAPMMISSLSCPR
jgi:hypothetical protein